jgi:hypothetical protein
MDYTGTRRAGREFSAFFKSLADSIISSVHPSIHDSDERDVVHAWRIAGYSLASHLVPRRKKRFPVELESFIQGARQRMEEYEDEMSLIEISALDVEACERVESKAEKFLRLATHPSTPLDEARNAALGLAKMIASSELSVLSWARVRHFAQHLSRMEELFETLRRENPLLFTYGTREQLKRH